MAARIYFHFFNLIILIFAGCGQQLPSRTPLDDFAGKETQVLNGKDIILANDSVLFNPIAIQVFDTLAICFDNDGYSAFAIVNLKNGELLKRFAFSGDGPSNFDINTLKLSRIFNSTNKFSVQESAYKRQRVLIYDIDSLLKTNNYEPRLYPSIPKKIRYTNILIKNDSMVLGKTDFSELDDKMFGLFNVKNNKLLTAIDVPKTPDDKYQEFYKKGNISWTKNVLHGDFEFRPGGSEIAYFSGKGALIQIFSIENNSTFDIKHQKLYYLPTFTIQNHGPTIVKPNLSPDCRYGFNDIAVTKDRIYALFNGKLTETNDLKALSCNVVLVYDWNGVAIQKIQLDRDCYKISIDPANPNELIALSSYSHIGLSRYKLPK